MALAVARPNAPRKLRKRSHADRGLFVGDANARLIPSTEVASVIYPTHDLSCLQGSTSLIAMITYAPRTRSQLRLSSVMTGRIAIPGSFLD
jgi:hypothetical protein